MVDMPRGHINRSEFIDERYRATYPRFAYLRLPPKGDRDIVANPERLDEVTATLDHWEKLEGSQAQGRELKWKEQISGLSVSEISELIVRQDEQMDFYRKSTPFACLLSDDDRILIIHKYKFN